MTETPFGLSTIGQILVPATRSAPRPSHRDAPGLPFLPAFPHMAFDADGVRSTCPSPNRRLPGQGDAHYRARHRGGGGGVEARRVAFDERPAVHATRRGA